MLKVALIISQPGFPTREVESGGDALSVGSALDNSVPLEADAGVARYHAFIERRGETYWLSNLGGHATKVNGAAVELERALRDGDRITLGEKCVIEFYRYDAAQTPPPAAPYPANSARLGDELGSAVAPAVGAGVSAAAARGSRAAEPTAAAAPAVAAEDAAPGVSPAVKIGVGVFCGLALTGAVAALLFNSAGGDCRPTARILTPVNGTPVRSPVTIRVEASETQCIKRVSYQLDGEEVASASAPPYEATLNPRRLTSFAAGNHILTATVETADGAQLRQPGEVYVAVGRPAGERPGGATPAPEAEATPAPDAPNAPPASADVQAMAERLASQISGKGGYVFEREMTARIQARTSEFAAVNAAERAARYRRVVIKSFGTDNGVEPFIGFVLGMSRSKFDDGGAGRGGPWRVPPEVAQAYLRAGEPAGALDDPQRAAEVSAVYFKHLRGVFKAENFDLAVACYGCTIEDAGKLDQRLAGVPAAERRNFWRLFERGLLTEEQAERVVRFYAAGVVGENPRRFGVPGDQRLSDLVF